MPTRWLAANTHLQREHNWGYISLCRVLDKLKDNLDFIVEQQELIHNEGFMMGMMDKWTDELPDFRNYLTHKFEKEKTGLFASSSNTKVVCLKRLW